MARNKKSESTHMTEFKTWVEYQKINGVKLVDIARALGISRADLNNKIYNCTTLESEFYVRFRRVKAGLPV